MRRYELIPQLTDKFYLVTKSQSLQDFLGMLVMWLYLFVPAFFIGGAFPLVNRIYGENKKTDVTGLVYFWDTFGGIVGAAIAGFVLLPYTGYTSTIIIACFINLAIAYFVTNTNKYRFFTVIALVIVVFIASQNVIEIENSLNNPVLNARFGKILFQKNSPYGVVTVGTGDGSFDNNKALFINYRDMCHTQEHASETSIASTVTKFLPAESTVLNIGLGCGFTASKVEQSINVNTLDIIEINPVVAEAAKMHFNTENKEVLSSKKTNLIIEDGAKYVRNTKKTYNAVIIDIEEPTIVTSSILFTNEYFSKIKGISDPNGILAIWTGKGSDEFAKVIYNTLKNNYRYVYIRTFGTFYSYSFFASDNEDVQILPETKEETDIINAILVNKVTEINTIDQRNLSKYFDVNTYFRFPETYKEPNTGL